MMQAEAEGSAAWEARCLLRSARAGTLATAAEGQPFASLVTPACAPDLAPMMLLSSLSEHTRHLRADARCALLVAGAPVDANPQTAPRLTLTGSAEQVPPEAAAAMKARWVAVHPYAAFYADFGDFSLWRLRIAGASYVGGFARAHRLTAAALTPDPAAVAAIAAAEAGIIAHCNDDHADALETIAVARGAGTGAWRMVAADVDGMDLARADAPDAAVLRVPWSAPVAEAGAVRTELVRMARAARG